MITPTIQHILQPAKNHLIIRYGDFSSKCREFSEIKLQTSVLLASFVDFVWQNEIGTKQFAGNQSD